MSEGDVLGRDDIFAMDDIPLEKVLVPEWGNRTVWVCGLTGAGKDAYSASLVEFRGESKILRLENATVKLVVRTCCDAGKKLLFSEADIEKLGTKSSAALERLAAVARRLSGMDKKEIDELAKNSDAARSADSPTGSL